MSERVDGQFTYIGVCECGKIIAAAVDLERHRKDTAKDVARWVRRGLKVERVPTADVRVATWCDCNKTPRQGSLKGAI